MITRLEKLWERDRAYANRYTLVFTSGIFIHLLLGTVFAVYGRYWLAALNGVGIGVYLVWIWFFSRIPVNTPMLVTPYFNVMIHAAIYNVVLGSECAFYLYPYAIIPVTFYLSSRDSKRKYADVISAVMAVISTGVMLATLTRPALMPFTEPGRAQQMFQINIMMCTILLAMFTAEFQNESKTARNSLSRHAEYDQLTGLRNRYNLKSEIEKLMGTQFGVVMCDIDDFKFVNDTYGHTTGDQLLSRIGKTLQGCVRREDILCRWGGEEFLLIIRSSAEDTRSAVERIRRKLGTVSVMAGDTPISVTMTFGVADCLEADSFDKLVSIADSNLLRGKRSGKNCVVTSQDTTQLAARSGMDTNLDVSHLNSRVFAAFAATSDTTYIYMCNLSSNVSRWSKTAVDYFGLPGEYMVDAGNVWLGFVHPDDREAYSADVEAVLSGRKHYHDVTYRARNRNGEYVTCVCRGVVTEGDAAHPALFAGTITNLGPAEYKR